MAKALLMCHEDTLENGFYCISCCEKINKIIIGEVDVKAIERCDYCGKAFKKTTSWFKKKKSESS